MSEPAYTIETPPSRVGWFAAGALAVAAAVGLFLYADGYFAPASEEIPVDMPPVIIEGN